MILASFRNLVGPDLIVILLILGVLFALPVLIGVTIVLVLKRRQAKPPPLPISTR
jgi:hypothetical protein